ncbi:MAG: hypothetical protein FWE79_02995, partial [Firmicutes bacterium]|nr:hypothetical protein [Bacillota bacterium]
MPKDKQVYSFDEMMSLEECVKKAYYIDECKFLLNSELLDVEDRFRIFCLSNKKYIVKKSKIHKAKNEIEKAVEAEKRIDNLNILDKKIKVVVPQLIKHGCNGYLVSEYLGQTLQERVYSRKNNKIEFDVDFLFSVLETLLDKRVLYRGFLPRNTIVGKKTLYLIDWEDTVFIEQNEKPYISLL